MTPNRALLTALALWRRGDPVPLDVQQVLADAGYRLDIIETQAQSTRFAKVNDRSHD